MTAVTADEVADLVLDVWQAGGRQEAGGGAGAPAAAGSE
jgi:hypothetical protein